MHYITITFVCVRSSYVHVYIIVIYCHPQGGESTSEEMCLSFIYYYPESFFTYCISYPNTDQYEDWIREYAP